MTGLGQVSPAMENKMESLEAKLSGDHSPPYFLKMLHCVSYCHSLLSLYLQVEVGVLDGRVEVVSKAQI